MSRFPADYESRRIQDLDPDFRPKVEELISNLAKKGLTFRPFFTIRGPEVQARLWAQSRTPAAVDAQISTLRRQGAPRVAELLEKQRKRAGGRQRVTNALPGRSWHQWGLAVDLFREINGKAVWNNASYIPLRDEAVRLGLVSGASFHDWVHVQRDPGSPAMSWPEIERRLLELYIF